LIAVDTNILVYGHREDSQWHKAADACLTHLAESGTEWAIPWPCIHEFLAIVTHPRIYDPPTPVLVALDQIECWLEAPTLMVIGEAEGYWQTFRGAVERGKITGPQVHDARVAALCLQHAVKELWTADRDFTRFKRLKIRNPLVEG
jgi:Predicted nucleic acid-binding protein, contains PIN domain